MPARQPDDAAHEVSVSFQSIANSEPWWSPHEHDGKRLGIVARHMSRRNRVQGKAMHIAASRNSQFGEDLGSLGDELHGYQGRWFCLVQAPAHLVGDKPVKLKDAKAIPGAYSLVQIWRTPTSEPAASMHAKRKRQAVDPASFTPFSALPVPGMPFGPGGYPPMFGPPGSMPAMGAGNPRAMAQRGMPGMSGMPMMHPSMMGGMPGMMGGMMPPGMMGGMPGMNPSMMPGRMHPSMMPGMMGGMSGPDGAAGYFPPQGWSGGGGGNSGSSNCGGDHNGGWPEASARGGPDAMMQQFAPLGLYSEQVGDFNPSMPHMLGGRGPSAQHMMGGTSPFPSQFAPPHVAPHGAPPLGSCGDRSGRVAPPGGSTDSLPGGGGTGTGSNGGGGTGTGCGPTCDSGPPPAGGPTSSRGGGLESLSASVAALHAQLNRERQDRQTLEQDMYGAEGGRGGPPPQGFTGGSYGISLGMPPAPWGGMGGYAHEPSDRDGPHQAAPFPRHQGRSGSAQQLPPDAFFPAGGRPDQMLAGQWNGVPAKGAYPGGAPPSCGATTPPPQLSQHRPGKGNDKGEAKTTV